MKFIDLSQPIFADCPHCPLDPSVQVSLAADHARDGWRVETLTLTAHTGSHVDAPLHKFAGTLSIDSIPLERFAGPAVLADLRDARPGQPFTSSQLSRKLRTVPLEDHIVLIATGWGRKRAHTEEWLHQSPFLAPDGAEWLAEQGIRGVGIDCWSIGGGNEPQNSLTHEALLKAGIWIVEELQFPDAAFDLPQPFQYAGLPVNLRGMSGAFCRPVIVLP
jgi:kynurenine formamidase